MTNDVLHSHRAQHLTWGVKNHLGEIYFLSYKECDPHEIKRSPCEIFPVGGHRKQGWLATCIARIVMQNFLHEICKCFYILSCICRVLRRHHGFLWKMLRWLHRQLEQCRPRLEARPGWRNYNNYRDHCMALQILLRQCINQKVSE